jgi:hypothetical protein
MRGDKEEVNQLLEAIEMSEYISSCYVSSSKTSVTLAYVIANKD